MKSTLQRLFYKNHTPPFFLDKKKREKSIKKPCSETSQKSSRHLLKTGFISPSGEKTTHFDLFVEKLTHLIMKHGKKTQATKLVFTMLLILKQKIKQDGEKKNLKTSSPVLLVTLLFQALENLTPSLEVRKVRVAGSTYLVPAALSKKKQENLAFKWLIESAKKRQKNSKRHFSECLADEFIDASKKAGFARQKRDELHRLAQQNRAYVRYRWW